MGRDAERSVLVLSGVGESWTGPARCFGGDEEGASCNGGWLGGDEFAAGDFGGPPNADINDNTMQGVSVHNSSGFTGGPPLDRPISNDCKALHVQGSKVKMTKKKKNEKKSCRSKVRRQECGRFR